MKLTQFAIWRFVQHLPGSQQILSNSPTCERRAVFLLEWLAAPVILLYSGIF